MSLGLKQPLCSKTAIVLSYSDAVRGATTVVAESSQSQSMQHMHFGYGQHEVLQYAVLCYNAGCEA